MPKSHSPKARLARGKAAPLPKPRIGCVRFNDIIGSMHLTSPLSVRAHETDVVHYAAVIPCRTAKEARRVVKMHGRPNDLNRLIEIEMATKNYLRVHHSKGGEDYDGTLSPLIKALNLPTP